MKTETLLQSESSANLAISPNPGKNPQVADLVSGKLDLPPR